MLERVSTRYACDVYGTCMSRTNLIIDDDLLDRVMRRYGLRTKTEAVDLALRHLAGRPMTTEEALGMRGIRAVLEIPPDQGPP
jgi:Arc/MetJ family transcription regulator